MTPHARKTYVLSFYNEHGNYTQRYFQNRKEALVEQAHMRKDGKACFLSFWIDGAEMVRLARLGYRYDSKTDSVVRSRNAKGFAQEVDAMPTSKRESMFLDYRKFKTSEDVIKFHIERRKA